MLPETVMTRKVYTMKSGCKTLRVRIEFFLTAEEIAGMLVDSSLYSTWENDADKFWEAIRKWSIEKLLDKVKEVIWADGTESWGYHIGDDNELTEAYIAATKILIERFPRLTPE